MDMDQIVKRLEWLDEERRRDKDTILLLREQMDGLMTQLPTLSQKFNEIEGEVNRMSAQLSRFDRIDEQIMAARVELTRMIEEAEKRLAKADRSIEKTYYADFEKFKEDLGAVEKRLEALPGISDRIDARQEEEFRLSRLIEEVDNKITQGRRNEEEYQRTTRLLEEGRRQDAKRLADLQSETNMFRKRLEEQRGKMDLLGDSVRRFESRMNDLKNAEAERRQEQLNFLEKQNLVQVDRDRNWKDWQNRFAQFTEKFEAYDQQMRSLELLSQKLQGSQKTFDNVNDQMERRIHEITEMQRLTTERMREDWDQFKGDDQKRWSNYMLQEEERDHELDRQLLGYEQNIKALNQLTEQMEDDLTRMGEQNIRKLQRILKTLQDLLNDQQGA
ncbi:MAG: hypothetical protein JW750_09205 [Anaerolineaceae bacterium]|nr:hypothetical protein [Anaerolineaceae bacterium]